MKNLINNNQNQSQSGINADSGSKTGAGTSTAGSLPSTDERFNNGVKDVELSKKFEIGSMGSSSGSTSLNQSTKFEMGSMGSSSGSTSLNQSTDERFNNGVKDVELSKKFES